MILKQLRAIALAITLATSTASIALVIPAKAFAEVVQVRDSRFEAVVSADEMSRIAITGDKVVSVRSMNEPDGPQMLVEAEEATGDVYVAFDGDVMGRTFTLFLVTQSNQTIQAVLTPAAVSGQTVTVNMGAAAAQASAGQPVERSERRNGYMETVSALMRHMFNGEAPQGVTRDIRTTQPSRVGPFELRVTETYQVANLRGQVLSVKNASTAAVPVVVDTFLVAGVLAASADRTDLQPGMSGRIFLVEEVR